jgi:hypothetical protein
VPIRLTVAATDTGTSPVVTVSVTAIGVVIGTLSNLGVFKLTTGADPPRPPRSGRVAAQPGQGLMVRENCWVACWPS